MGHPRVAGDPRLAHPIGGTAYTIAVAFTTDGRHLITGGSRRLCVWDVGTGALVRSMDTGLYLVQSIAVLPGGRQSVTGGGRWANPGEVKIWNVLTGENTLTFRGFGREVTGVAVSPDGAVAACTHEGIVRVWNHRTAADREKDARRRADADADRGRALVGDGRWAEAADALRAAIAARPDDPLYRRELAGVLVQLGDPTAALAAAREAAKLAPEDGMARYTLGVALEAGGHHDAAAAAFAAFPDNAVPWVRSSACAFNAGDLTAAVSAARAAVRLDPNLAVAPLPSDGLAGGRAGG